VSLFSGAGIGDLGLRASGFEYLLLTELDPPRADLAAGNFPEAKTLTGDIWELKDHIVDLVEAELASRGQELSLVSCTAPCQGMSKSGRGTLLRNIRLGKRPQMDPRNRLILPALEVIKRLQPKWVVFENVSEMADTLIEDESGEVRPILEILEDQLGLDYSGRPYDLEFADYGVPQRRRRLITVYTRTEIGKRFSESGGEFVPDPTHASIPKLKLQPWVPVSTILKRFPPLDAGDRTRASNKAVPFHRVPLLDERKYEWVRNTPPGKGAFDNQCIECGFAGNPIHKAVRTNGINQPDRGTPIRCIECNAVLPRPSVVGPDGEPRIMSGFTSAYKRMSGDLPAPALTRNLSYACSDQKLHPTQHRVLSLAEAFAVHTLDQYRYDWTTQSGKVASDGLIRLVIGESIPPKAMELIGQHLLGIERGHVVATARAHQYVLPGMPG
jgi:DNA (cytosine-5)-methyltransferase 1